MKIIANILKIASCLFNWLIILIFVISGWVVLMIAEGANKPAEFVDLILLPLIFCLSGIMVHIPNSRLLSTKKLSIPFVILQLIVAGYFSFELFSSQGPPLLFRKFILLFGAYSGLISLLLYWLSVPDCKSINNIELNITSNK